MESSKRQLEEGEDSAAKRQASVRKIEPDEAELPDMRYYFDTYLGIIRYKTPELLFLFRDVSRLGRSLFEAVWPRIDPWLSRVIVTAAESQAQLQRASRQVWLRLQELGFQPTRIASVLSLMSIKSG